LLSREKVDGRVRGWGKAVVGLQGMVKKRWSGIFIFSATCM
jgi:hypothetical protein